ncbi:MAG: 2-amino-4-hydroxy-6-hydroxymethyldihydropteridine diphosphokinase [Pirellula sp.]|nr:2-amino-4-hydroxy-6-hydroxymethyldihydropteridine diphosphokinase [Pirellula sp.]
MAHALVALGSNVGNRRQTLDDACRDLTATPGIDVVRTSRWYETSPVGGPGGQHVFLNGAALLETSLAPLALLDALQAVESTHGRVREIAWGPRTLDLDVLLYDDLVLQSQRLTLPHPRLSYRKFVLEGAVKIAGAMRHPRIGRTLDELWQHLAKAPHYVAFVGHLGGFRMQFAAEAADAAGASLVEATADDVAPFETLSSLNGLLPSQVLQFVNARAAAVTSSLTAAGDRWVVDDGWWSDEFRELAECAGMIGLPAEIAVPPTPRLIARLITSQSSNDAPSSGLPEVVLDISRREDALMEFAAALEAAH